jgi:DNA-binding FadR family transcriptional regulator
MFTSIKTRRSFEEAVEQIAQAIRAGDLEAGDKLPSERDLSTQMGISRPTVREAIKLLADAGVVEVRPGARGGTFVASVVVPRNLVEARSELRLAEIAGVLEARRLFEPRVAQLAALRGTEKDFDDLRKTIDLQRQAGDDREHALQLDLRFHLRIAHATQNATLVAMMQHLLKQLEIARDMALRGEDEPALAIAIHERTLEAILSGDPEAVEIAMDEHMSFLEKIWEGESGRPCLRRPPDFLLPYAERTRSGR